MYICCNCLNLKRYFLWQSLLHNVFFVLCNMCFECILKVSYIQVNLKMMWILLHYHIYQVNICRLLATFWCVIQISYDKVNSILFSMQLGSVSPEATGMCVMFFSVCLNSYSWFMLCSVYISCVSLYILSYVGSGVWR